MCTVFVVKKSGGGYLHVEELENGLSTAKGGK